jgi:hypothetical protein
MEQLVLILIIGAISLINWLIEQSGKRREQQRLQRERESNQVEGSAYQDSSPPTDRLRPATQPEPSREVRELLEVFGVPLPAPESPHVIDSRFSRAQRYSEQNCIKPRISSK